MFDGIALMLMPPPRGAICELIPMSPPFVFARRRRSFADGTGAAEVLVAAAACRVPSVDVMPIVTV